MRGLVAVAVVLVACSGTQSASSSDAGVTTCAAEGGDVLAQRCASCHAAAAADRQRAPVSATFDTPEQVRRHAAAIERRAVEERTMPPGAPLDDCEAQALAVYLDAMKALSCAPECDGRQCGDDGCGGSCGTCGAGEECDAGQCVAVSTCTPSCDGRTSGGDGCGGQCTCAPSCAGKSCGSDGCGGTCGTCDSGQSCDAAGQCACTPSCAGRSCGDDGCGGSCGACGSGTVCSTAQGSCVTTCSPSCTGKTCGDDGCGGSCGACAGGQSCANGQCACAPRCSGKMCGPDGCGGACGTCASGSTCDASGRCVAPAPTFAASVFPIFQAKGCGTSACHGGSTPSESLNLSNAAIALAELVGVASAQCSRTLVVPNDVAASYLVNKLTGQGMCGGTRMPRNGSALSAAQLDTIRAWINGGAR